MEYIGDNAFKGCTELTELIVPVRKELYFGENIFEGRTDKLTVYGYKDTDIEKYAKDNNIRFVVLNDDGSKPAATTSTAATTAAAKTTAATTANNNSPQTGDSGAVGIALTGIAAVLLSAAAYRKRKD